MTDPLFRKGKRPTHTKMPKLHLYFVLGFVVKHSVLHESIRAQSISKHAVTRRQEMLIQETAKRIFELSLNFFDKIIANENTSTTL